MLACTAFFVFFFRAYFWLLCFTFYFHSVSFPRISASTIGMILKSDGFGKSRKSDG